MSKIIKKKKKKNSLSETWTRFICIQSDVKSAATLNILCAHLRKEARKKKKQKKKKKCKNKKSQTKYALLLLKYVEESVGCAVHCALCTQTD